MKKPTIAFLGIGIMGHGMIKNLQKNNFSLRLYNRNIDKAKNIAQKSDVICKTPREAAQNADIIVASVFDDKASKAIWFGKDGAINCLKNNTICIETSTLSIKYINYWGKKISNLNSIALDCPLTGSKAGAEDGTLTLFVGSKKKYCESLLPIFRSISKQQYYFDHFGMAMKFKLAYNLLGANILISYLEFLQLNLDFSLDIQKTNSIIASNKQGWSASVAKSKGKNLIYKNHAIVSCALETLYKDLYYCRNLINKNKRKYYISKHSLIMFKKAMNNNLGKLDISAVGDLFF